MIEINKNAPVKCKKTIIINAHSVAVWEVLTGIDKWVRWQPAIKKSKLNGELEAGTSFDWKTGGLSIRSTIHTVEPYTNFGWSGKSLGLTAVHNWNITEMNNQSEIMVEESMEGMLTKIFTKLFNKTLDKSLQKWLEALKKECERFEK